MLLQILNAIEKLLGEPVIDYFDWVAGTSTGSFVAAALCRGKDLKYCQRLYLRLKDQLFEGWVRPYNTERLENFMKAELGGDEVTMADTNNKKLLITTVKADYHPVVLKLFRSWKLPTTNPDIDTSDYTEPSEQVLWRAMRASSAAPTYFTSAEGKYLDGGLIANNPTLDLLAEVDNWNTALELEEKPSAEKLKVGCVLSVGTGKIPRIPMECIDLGVGTNPYQSAMAMKSLAIMFVDQVTATEGAPVQRARAWCNAIGTPYFRFSTPMSKDLMMDCTDDTDLVTLMWEATEYVHHCQDQIQEIVDLIKLTKACKIAGLKHSDSKGKRVEFE